MLEVWPEPGWYTEIIAPLLREQGKYYAAVIAPDPASSYVTKRLAGYQEKLASRPDLYDKVTVVTLPRDGSDVVPAGTLDMVVTFRNIHNWMSDGDAADRSSRTLYRRSSPAACSASSSTAAIRRCRRTRRPRAAT